MTSEADAGGVEADLMFLAESATDMEISSWVRGDDLNVAEVARRAASLIQSLTAQVEGLKTALANTDRTGEQVLSEALEWRQKAQAAIAQVEGLRKERETSYASPAATGGHSLAAPEVEPSAAWRAIETSDFVALWLSGDWVLLASTGEPRVICGKAVDVGPSGEPRRVGRVWATGGGPNLSDPRWPSAYLPYCATHWMPLPEPPGAESAAHPIAEVACDPADGPARDELEQALAEARKALEEMGRKVYRPGVLRCAKCDFRLVSSTLDATTGNVYARETTEHCPNDGAPMWRLSWEEECRAADKLWDQQFDRAVAAEAALEKARAALAPFAAKLVDIGDDEADDDRFRDMSPENRRAPAITVGDFRRARLALQPDREGGERG